MPSPLALADGETVHPVMGGQHGPPLVDGPSRCAPRSGPQESAGITGRDEADVMAVRLVRDRQAEAGRLRANLRLGRVPDRESGMAQLAGGQHRQHV